MSAAAVREAINKTKVTARAQMGMMYIPLCRPTARKGSVMVVAPEAAIARRAKCSLNPPEMTRPKLPTVGYMKQQYRAMAGARRIGGRRSWRLADSPDHY